MVRIFLDGPTLAQMAMPVHGYTFNPSLCRKLGVTDYRTFARLALECSGGKPVSFEVLADDLPTMNSQAREIASWGENVYVKIPVMTSEGDSTALLIHLLSNKGVKINVTAVMTLAQIRTIARTLSPNTPSIISIFAGRIADTGVDPTPLFIEASRVKHSSTETLWASTREPYNIKQAESCSADIITLSPEIYSKLSMFGKDLNEYSRETVKQFLNDSKGIQL